MYAAPLCPAVVISVGLTGQIVHAFAVRAFLGINQITLITGITQRADIEALLQSPTIIATIKKIILCGDVGNLPALREPAAKVTAGCKRVLEVAALLIVEADIHKAHLFVVEFAGIHEAELVERGTRLFQVVEFNAVGLRGDARRDGGIALTVQADGGRVGAHRGKVCAECVHGAAHAHIARRAGEVVAREGFKLVNVLRLGGKSCRKQQGGKNVFRFHRKVGF